MENNIDAYLEVYNCVIGQAAVLHRGQVIQIFELLLIQRHIYSMSTGMI